MSQQQTPGEQSRPSTQTNTNRAGAAKRTRRGSRGNRSRAPHSTNAQQSRGSGGGKKGAKSAKRSSRGRGSARARHPRSGNSGPMTSHPSRKQSTPLPPLAKDSVRVIPLGGVEEIGRNMTAIEFGDSIYVVDCGFQFREEDTPGVDYILPNTEYLEQNRDRVRAMLITHGHLDHIGGIPYILDRIGNPPIYTRKLTGVMIKKKLEEFPHLPKPDFREVEGNERVSIGGLSVSFFAVTHTIPDAMGIILETPYGDVVVTGDIKLDHENGVPTEAEQEEFATFKDRNVLLLLMDSTGVWQPGWSTPESSVFGTFEEIIPNAPGRLIIGTFASQLERLMKIIEIAERAGKKVVVEGRSMKQNIEIVRELGILKHKDDTIVSVENIEDYPPEKLVVLATGAQGDQYAALMRISTKSHKYITLKPSDTIVLSSSIVPGNERAVQRLKDNLSRQGAHIVTFQTSELYVHATGHGNAGEARWIHQQIKPKFFMPQHGHHYMLRVHADLIQDSIGIPENHIAIPDNSSVIEVQGGGKKIVKLKQKAPDSVRVVEGQHISELSDVLMRDRKALSQDGFCVVVATVDRRTGKLQKSPDIISRGFVYLRENTDLMNQTRLLVSKTVSGAFGHGSHPNIDDVKDTLGEVVSRFLLQQTHKNPMVIPVIVSV